MTRFHIFILVFRKTSLVYFVGNFLLISKSPEGEGKLNINSNIKIHKTLNLRLERQHRLFDVENCVEIVDSRFNKPLLWVPTSEIPNVCSALS